MPSTVAPSLVIRRTYSATPQRVYEAWTTPKLAEQFMGPYDVKATEIEMDLRTGGKFQIVMVKPDGERMRAFGVYREVKPAQKLVMTWSWEEDDPADQYETLLTLEFTPAGNGTELTLKHEQFPTEENRDNHQHGWSSIVEKLDEFLR
ncbi:MAG: SRPBCC family protein [Vulcanimicrobiaceae bacterium]